MLVVLGDDFRAGPVDSELQAYREVVFHAPHLAAEGDLILPERVHGRFELVAVDLQLLSQPHGAHLGLPRDQLPRDVDAPLPQHGVEDGGHGVLGVVVREDAHAPGLEVLLTAPVPCSKGQQSCRLRATWKPWM